MGDFWGCEGVSGSCGGGYGLESEVGRVGAVPFAPLLEEAAVAQGDVFLRGDAETGGGAVDPFRRAFELGIVADGGFIDDAVAFAVVPLGAPFLVAEGGDEAKGEKNFGKGVAVGDFSFSFNAVLVAVLSRAVGRQAFVSDNPAAGVAADAKNFGAGAHLALWRVVEDVALKAARGEERESGGLKPLGETGQVRYFEFDLGFDGHRKREYTAGGPDSALGNRRQ